MARRPVAAGQHRGTAAREASRAAAAAGLAAALLCSACVAGGCYRRVTGAQGIGADRYEISEPYQKDTRVDRWFYGSDNRRGGSRLP